MPTQAPVVPAGFDASAQKLADERLRSEKRAAEQLAAEKAESERAAAAKAELDREAAEKAAKAKTIADKAAKAQERLAVPKVEEKRAAPEADTRPEPAKVAVAVPDKPVLSPPAGDAPAFTYFLGFAHRGNGEAMLKVAESYESGRGVAQNGVWACGWYELAGRRGVSGAKARKEAVAIKLQPRELRQCQDWADGQAAPSG